MPDRDIPEYLFNFIGGISNEGAVERLCMGTAESRPSLFRYCLDDFQLASVAGRNLPPIAADVVDVFLAAYVADCLAPRDSGADRRPVHDRWHRRMRIVVPVRDPSSWRRAEVTELLDELLPFLTDDTWTIEFAQRFHAPRRVESQALLLGGQPPALASVFLFSGGLDSLAGIVRRLDCGDEEEVIPVSIISNDRIKATVKAVTSALPAYRATEGATIRPLHIGVHVSRRGSSLAEREPSQRLRGALFLAYGIAAAMTHGVDRLLLCENGFGAIGLPMMSDHWGARATKAVHPRTLLLFKRLVSTIADREIPIHNTGLFLTKGELVGRLAEASVLRAAQATSSCDRSSYRKSGHPCGECTSCILRRLSLLATGVTQIDDPLRYNVDLLDPSGIWQFGKLVPLLAMRSQVEQLRSAIGSGRFTELEIEFPDIHQVAALAPTLGLSREEIERWLLRLYRQYVHEFDVLAASIDRPGWGRQASVSSLYPLEAQAAAS